MVADRQIAAQVKEELIRHGAYFMTETEQKQLTAFLGLEKGTGLPDKEFIEQFPDTLFPVHLATVFGLQAFWSI